MKTLALLILTILPLSIIGCSRDQSGSLPDSRIKTPTLEQLEEDIPEGGNRTFVDSGQRLGNGRSWDVALGDLDGDNDLDTLVANGSVGMVRSQVWLNDGRGFFTAFGEPLGYGTGLDLGDLDGDGDLDAALVAWDQAGQVWWNDGKAGYVNSGQSLGREGGFDLTLGDLDGDSDLDIFIAHEKSNTVWFNNGSGEFEDSGQELGQGISAAVALADLDGDGDLDAATAGWDEPGKVWINNGSGIFSESGVTLSASTVHMHGLAWGDLSGDGYVDLILAGLPNQIWFNDGKGYFTGSDQDLPRSPGDTAALGDLDQDGDLDIYLAVGKTGQSVDQIWINDGRGSFLIPDLPLSGEFTSGVGLGDLDGDGDLDAYLTHGKLGLSSGGGLPNEVWWNTWQK